MDKKRLQRIWRYVHRIHPWYFLALTIVFGTISLFALRNNNLQMMRLRDAVFAADQSGDTAQLENALYSLRVHIYNHMNTSLTSGNNAVYPPIQLKYSYERAQAAQQAQLGQNNAGLYHEAQQSCTAQLPNATGAESISCIENYVSSRGVQLGNIPDGLYKFDFTSAKWSPDLAGWSLVVAILSGVVFIFSSTYRAWSKRNL